MSWALGDLDRRLAGRAIGGVGVVVGDSAQISAAWLPSSIGTPSETARFLHGLFGGRLCGSQSLAQLTTLTEVPAGPPRWNHPGYGLGVMAETESPVGPVYGHNGGGPGYKVSVFHAPHIAAGGITISAMSTLEGDDHLTEIVVLDALEQAFRSARVP